jgi:hypothetical protein
VENSGKNAFPKSAISDVSGHYERLWCYEWGDLIFGCWMTRLIMQELMIIKHEMRSDSSFLRAHLAIPWSRVAWEQRNQIATRWVPRPRILYPYPQQRFDARTQALLQQLRAVLRNWVLGNEGLRETKGEFPPKM